MRTYRVWVVTAESYPKTHFVDMTVADNDDIEDMLDHELYLEGILEDKNDSYRVIWIDDVTDDCFLED